MRFIRKWSYSSANYLTGQLKENHEKRSIYYYGFQIVIGGIVKGIILLVVAYLLGILIPTIAIFAFMGLIRVMAGGYHMDEYNKCLFTSMGMLVLSGLLVKYVYAFLPVGVLIALTVAVFVPGLFILKKYAPADTPYKPITKPEQIRRFKMLSIVCLCVWLVINLVLIYSKLYMFAFAGCIGVLFGLFFVMPAGYAFFDMISGKFDNARKKRKNRNRRFAER